MSLFYKLHIVRFKFPCVVLSSCGVADCLFIFRRHMAIVVLWVVFSKYIESLILVISDDEPTSPECFIAGRQVRVFTGALLGYKRLYPELPVKTQDMLIFVETPIL